MLEHATLWVIGDEAPGRARLTIGDGTRLARFNTVVCEVGVSIGCSVASSDNATILDTWTHPALSLVNPAFSLDGLEPAPVVIEDGAYLSMNSVVLPGVRVGSGAYVGEGAVVVDDVPPHTVVYGNPARAVRTYDANARRWEGELRP